MISRRVLTVWLALVAMIVSAVPPAVAQCSSCSRSGFFGRSDSGSYGGGHSRGGLFAGRTRGGGLFQRASYGSAGGEGRYHSGYGSAGGQGRYEAGCGQSYEAGCGQAAEAACGQSSNDGGSAHVEEANQNYTVPAEEFSQTPADGSWRPPVAIRTVRVVPVDLFTAPPATLLAAK